MSRWSFSRVALLHEVLELEHEIVGEGAEQPEQPVTCELNAAIISRTSDTTDERRVR